MVVGDALRREMPLAEEGGVVASGREVLGAGDLIEAQAIEQLLSMGVRAEQQALAKWGLNYVIEEYLPNKLRNTGAFLP